MADAGEALHIAALRHRFFQLGHMALFLFHRERAIMHHGDARAVVPAVLEALEPIHQDGGGRLFAGISYNSAHIFSFLSLRKALIGNFGNEYCFCLPAQEELVFAEADDKLAAGEDDGKVSLCAEEAFGGDRAGAGAGAAG